jgi:magnesium-transporting ATPase (P-type)
MTTFAGGWVVMPNTIDWNFVFSNMDFFKNPTLYITEIVIAVVYIVAVIWARHQDRKDLQMVCSIGYSKALILALLARVT